MTNNKKVIRIPETQENINELIDLVSTIRGSEIEKENGMVSFYIPKPNLQAKPYKRRFFDTVKSFFSKRIAI